MPRFMHRIRNNCRRPVKRVPALAGGKRPKGTSVTKSLMLMMPLTFIQMPGFEYKEGTVRYAPAPMYIAVQGRAELTPRRFEGRKMPLPKPVPIDPPVQVHAKAAAPETAEIKTREITVHFALNSAVLSASERRRLDGQRDLFHKAEEIEITGYTCRLGTKAYNDRLAAQRAETVRRHLFSSLTNGKTAAVVKGLGKCCYVSKSNTPNRRSVVKVVFKEKAPEKRGEGGEPNGQS